MYGLYGCGLNYGLPLAACATTYATALPLALPRHTCGLGLNLACGARYLW